jgi:hypothetical protein
MEGNEIPRRSEWKLLSTMQQWFLSNTIGRYSCSPVSAHLMIAWNYEASLNFFEREADREREIF